MFNVFVCNVLEVIFGIWLICVFIDFFFEIDIKEVIRTLIERFTNKKDEK